MKGLADIVIALADLAEAEGKLLRHNIIRLKYSFRLTLLSVVMVIAGLGLVLLALYQSLLVPLGPTVSALITGLAGLFLGGVAQWIDHLNIR